MYRKHSFGIYRIDSGPRNLFASQMKHEGEANTYIKASYLAACAFQVGFTTRFPSVRR